jgi:hypothetical protein
VQGIVGWIHLHVLMDMEGLGKIWDRRPVELICV